MTAMHRLVAPICLAAGCTTANASPTASLPSASYQPGFVEPAATTVLQPGFLELRPPAIHQPGFIELPPGFGLGLVVRLPDGYAPTRGPAPRLDYDPITGSATVRLGALFGPPLGDGSRAFYAPTSLALHADFDRLGPIDLLTINAVSRPPQRPTSLPTILDTAPHSELGGAKLYGFPNSNRLLDPFTTGPQPTGLTETFEFTRRLAPGLDPEAFAGNEYPWPNGLVTPDSIDLPEVFVSVQYTPQGFLAQRSDAPSVVLIARPFRVPEPQALAVLGVASVIYAAARRVNPR